MVFKKTAIAVSVIQFVFCFGARHVQAQAYTPDHPKVQAMVERGVRFLSGITNGRPGSEYLVGQPILVGYAVLKVTGDVDHPQVKRGIAAAQRLVGTLDNYASDDESKIVYESSVAAILLASADAGKYQPELGQILYFFESIQKQHGGFGYIHRSTGDTSQVQYVMLALWTMHEVDMAVPVDLVESTLQYVRATMDPSGGWGYQGKPTTGRLIAQEGVSKSLSTAGIGALMIGGDILGFYGQRKSRTAEDDGVPKAFIRIDLKEKVRAARTQVTMKRSDTDGAIKQAIRYQNTNRFGGGLWYYYWRYSQERYESFVEIVNNKQDESPPWYNQGVDDLAKLQSEDGAWGKKGIMTHTTTQVSTAFAVLFLIRSTQKSIGKLSEGVTFGGNTLPNDVSTIRMMGERIVSDEDTSVENLLSMLENEKVGNVQVGLLPNELQLTDDPIQRKEQVARLSRLLVSGDHLARQIAAKLLGRTDDMDVVPDLIYALTDPNDQVPMIAEESLRLLSRKLNSGELEHNPDDAQRKAAERFWKAWYLGLRPDYIFIAR